MSEQAEEEKPKERDVEHIFASKPVKSLVREEEEKPES